MKTPFNVLRRVNQWEVSPRDPVTVGGYILAGISGAGFNAVGAAVATAVFGSAITTIVGYLATTAITSWALSALAPDVGGIGGSRGLMVNATDPAAPHDIVYGAVRKGGVRTYVESTGAENKFLHMILVLAGHELAGIDDIYLNDEVVALDAGGFVTSGNWNSKVRIKKHLGNEIVADALLVAESNQIDANFVGNGIAYLYIRLEYDQDVFANGVPMFTAKVRGRKVYDPRTANTSYSANASLAVRDYIAADFGLNDSAVDDLAFAASASVADEAISLDGGGAEPRYEINGVVSSNMSPRTIVSRMMSACGGTLFWGQGKWQLHVGYYSSPVKTFTLDDLRGPISLDTRVSSRDNFNRVVGTFADVEVDYITSDFPPIESTVFLAEDNGVENTLDMQLPLTTSGSAAQRLAKMTLFRAREQMTLSAEFGLEAFGVQVGDIVAFTNERYGWTAKEFEVVGWRFETSGEGGDLRINLTLRETSEAAFAWNAEERQIIHNNTNLPDYTAGLTVNGLTASGGGKTQKDGTFIASTILSWAAATNAFISHYEIEWKPLADSNYSSTTTTGTSIELSPIIDAVEYVFRVQAISVLGNGGSISSVTYTVGGDISAPNVPTNLSAEAGYKYITVDFDLPTASDFNRVETYEGTSANFAAAVSIGFTSGNRFVRTGLGNNATRYYWVRSQDHSGNNSAFVGPVNATTFLVEQTDLTQSLIDTIEAAGVSAVNSLPATGDFDGQIVFLLTDNTLYRWDETGGVWSNELYTGIADGSVSETSIANGSISTPKLQTNSVTANQISAGAVTTDKLVAGAVVANKIAAGAVTADKLNVSELSAITAQIGTFQSAPSGERVVITDDKIDVYDSSNVLRVRIGNLV